MNAADRIADLLANPGHIDHPPTAVEIAADLGLSTSTVQAALRKLEANGTVAKLGVADSGRTWTLSAVNR